MSLRIGIDIGSTTVKVVVLDEQNKLLFRSYERHYSKARDRAAETLRSIRDKLTGQQVRIVITGSAGLGVAKAADIDFVQEVYATAAAVNQYIPDTDAVIELGGEDAKIIFFGGALEERMNGSCAGGTGAFIDQMATLMNVSVDELDELSLKHEKIYPIASRCGVFAKSDIQPILNQGGRKEDVAASIFQAVVDQTVAGLTQGRELKGKIVFLGGPLHFLKGLRQRFVETLKLDEAHAIFPEDGDCFAGIGAALCSSDYAERPFDDPGLPLIVGVDWEEAAVDIADRNANAAGVGQNVRFFSEDYTDTPLPKTPGILFMNPPYGERLEDEESLVPLYEGIGRWLRNDVPEGWRAWVITSSKPLSLKIGLRTSAILPFKNGPLDCRLIGYDIHGPLPDPEPEPEPEAAEPEAPAPEGGADAEA